MSALRITGPAWWTCGTVTVINALTSAGFSLAGLWSTMRVDGGQARTFAMYATARSVPLALITLWVVLRRRASWLAPIALVMAIVQACDAVVGLTQHDVGKAVGPVVFAAATIAAAAWWSRSGEAHVSAR